MSEHGHDQPQSLAVQENGMTLQAVEPPEAGLREYLGALRRRKWTILMCLVAVVAAACAYTMVTPRVYEATATLLVTDPAANRDRGMSDQLQLPAMVEAMSTATLETHVNLIESGIAWQEASTWLAGRDGPSLSPKQIAGSVSARVIPKTQLIAVSARSRSRWDAERIATAAAQSYALISRRWAQASSDSASRYLGEQLMVAKRNLTDAEEALRVLKESIGTVAEDAAAASLLGRASSLRADGDKTTADLAQAEEQLAQVRAQLTEQNRSIATSQVRDNNVVQQLRARLVDLEGQRLALEAKYTSAMSGPLDPINEQIRATKQQLDAEIRTVVRSGGGDLAMQQELTNQLIQGEATAAALKARQRNAQTQLRSAEAELRRVPARQVALARVQRQVEVAQGIYSDLLKRSQEVEVSRNTALGNADVIKLATVPDAPVRPNVLLNLVAGVLLGLGLGVGLAALREQFDDAVRSEDDATRLADAPLLSMVPVLKQPQAAPGLADSPAGSAAIEAYRGLRYALRFIAPGEGAQVVLVTSAGPQEGKTTTALNLATTAAMGGRKVVLVDSDLRQPSIHRLLGLHDGTGFSELLAGKVSLSEALRTIPESGLQVIASGTSAPNPADLLDSGQMRQLVTSLRASSDMVVLDSPPLLSSADGLILAQLSDALLVVCRPGTSQRRALQRARTLLAQIGRRFSGVVLNRVSAGAGYDLRYSSYYAKHDRTKLKSTADSIDRQA